MNDQFDGRMSLPWSRKLVKALSPFLQHHTRAPKLRFIPRTHGQEVPTGNYVVHKIQGETIPATLILVEHLKFVSNALNAHEG